jgi:glycosyltransferase involved in cell wall biosynthesis
MTGSSTMPTQPLVSCLMPTRNRRHFVGQAIRYFLRQDYLARELLIVDDGSDAVADLVPDDPRIQYVRLDRPLPLGAKRNVACEMSCGELIAHWDDDDWIAPHRLSAQVGRLLAVQADVCGADRLLYYRSITGCGTAMPGSTTIRPSAGRVWWMGRSSIAARPGWSTAFRPTPLMKRAVSSVSSAPTGSMPWLTHRGTLACYTAAIRWHGISPVPTGNAAHWTK